MSTDHPPNGISDGVSPRAKDGFQAVVNEPAFPKQANALGAASVAVALIGLAICVCGAFWGSFMQQGSIADSRRIAHTNYERGNPTILVEKVGVGLSYVSQLAIYCVSALVGGTFSLIGFALGVASLPNQHSRIGLVSIGLSALGPLLLLLCFCLMY